MSHKNADYRLTYTWLPPITFLLSFIVLYFASMPLLDDPDVPWHLATGRLLLETGTLPHTDPWSFASNGAPWYNLSWLWQVIISGIEQSSGIFAVYLFAITISAGIISTQAKRLAQHNIDPQAIFLTLLLTTLCMVEFTSARPHLFGYVMILAFCNILHLSRRSKRFGSLLLLPLCMLLWVNAHGSFLVGFTLLGAYGIEAIATRQKVWLKRLLFVSATCVVTACINPYGLSVITGAMQSIDSDLRNYIIEWQPFAFGQSMGLSIWMVMFIIAGNIRNPAIPLADKVMSIAWFIGTLLITRNGAIFMLVSAPYLASCLDIQTRDLREKKERPYITDSLSDLASKRLWRVVNIIAALFMVGAYFTPHESRIASEKRSIADVIAYIESNHPKRRYLSDFDFGGQIIYHTDGDIAFFMDSRSNTSYSSEEMQNYLSYWLLEPGWQNKIKPYRIDGIIAHKASKFAKSYADGHYQDSWHLVFAGQLANVYIAAP